MITSDEMRKLEEQAENQGITKLKLMEEAGLSLYEELQGHKGSVLIVSNHGNNGGDGLVLARYLAMEGRDVKVFFIGQEKKLKKESGFNYLMLKEKFPDIFISDLDKMDSFDIIVDAIFGTGIRGEIKEPYKTAIEKINSSGKYIISVDIPSGLDPDTGIIHDIAIKPDIIVTFHDIKPGLRVYEDITIIGDIGLSDGEL